MHGKVGTGPTLPHAFVLFVAFGRVRKCLSVRFTVVQRIFAGEAGTRRLNTIALVVLGAVLLFTVLKGQVTRPHEWALTELHLNYRYGLVRRGLVGELLEVVHRGKPPVGVFDVDMIFATVVLITWLTVLVRELRARLRVVSPEKTVAAMRLMGLFVFVSSPVIWNLAMCFGYLDPLFFVAGLLVVACRPGRVLHVVLALLLVLLAMFIHEMSGLLLGPLLLFFAFDPTAPWGVSRRNAAIVLPALAGLAVSTLLLARCTPSPALEQQMLTRAWTSPEWVHMLCELLRVKVSPDLRATWADAHVLARFRANAVLCLPASIALMVTGFCRLGGARITRRAKMLGALLLAVASCSQLVTNLVAFDATRLFALTNMQAFLALSMLDRRLEGVPSGLGKYTMAWLMPFTGAIAVAGLLTRGQFTYLPVMWRLVPGGFDPVLWDPLTRLGRAVGTFF